MRSTCVFETDFGLSINCGLKKSGIFRVRNLGGLKGYVGLGKYKMDIRIRRRLRSYSGRAGDNNIILRFDFVRTVFAGSQSVRYNKKYAHPF